MTQKKRDTLAALGFLAPNFIGFALFVAFPVIFSVVLVVTNWNLKPAVEPRFTGLDNVWRLVGFRPIEGAEPSGGLFWIAAFLGSYALSIGGVIFSLTSLARQMAGLRLGGWIGLATSIGLVAASFLTSVGVGPALVAIFMLFGCFFFLTDDDSAFAGPAALGPGMITFGIIGIYLLKAPVLARWEPIDPNFYYYLYNTLYLIVAIPITIVGSLALALILSEPILRTRARNKWGLGLILSLIGVVGVVWLWKAGMPDQGVLWGTFWLIAALGIAGGIYAFRTLFYIPTFTAGIAVMLLWKQMFNPTFGPLNEGLRIIFNFLHIDAEPPRWLSDPDWAKPAIMLMGFWMLVGGQNMLLYLAGLSNIPKDLYEAASIDGANRWQGFWNVTWPQLAPTTFFIVIMSTILGLQGGFEQARVLTEGGPAGSTKTLAYYVYEKAFEELELGYASGIAWVLFVLVFLLTALNWRFGNRYVNY